MKYFIMIIVASLLTGCEQTVSPADVKRIKCLCKTASKYPGTILLRREDRTLYFFCSLEHDNQEGHISDRTYVDGCD